MVAGSLHGNRSRPQCAVRLPDYAHTGYVREDGVTSRLLLSKLSKAFKVVRSFEMREEHIFAADV